MQQVVGLHLQDREVPRRFGTTDPCRPGFLLKSAVRVLMLALAVMLGVCSPALAAGATDDPLVLGLKQRALAAHRRGELNRAIQLYSRVLEAENLSVEERALIYHNRGAASAVQGQLELALNDFDTAIGLAPPGPSTWVQRAVVLAASDRHEEALSDLAEAIDRDPTLAVAFYERGQIHWSLDDLDAAAADFRRAAELKPERSLYRDALHEVLAGRQTSVAAWPGWFATN